MALVRSLQEAFYASDNGDSSNDASEQCRIQFDTGRIQNLPIWHVSWTELPGRSNILSVHDPSYTHMFEGLLRNKDKGNVYFGHLYRPPWSSGEALTSWRDDENNENENTKESSNDNGDESSRNNERRIVIGTLMRVVDHRRLKDGKLLLLVQGLERFVVDSVQQLQPYSVADVQILPDLEELAVAVNCELGNVARVRAVQESFRWHDFEYDPSVKLPLRSNAKEITVSDVYGPDLIAVMPHVGMAPDTEPPQKLTVDDCEAFSSKQGDVSLIEAEDIEKY